MIPKAAVYFMRCALALVCLFSPAGAPLWAGFQSVQVVTMSAGIAFTQGSPGRGAPHLATTPATHAYPVSGILQVGGIASMSPVSLSAPRIARPAPGVDTFQVQLSYKTAVAPQVMTTVQQGRDPFQFVFTLPTSVVVNSGGSVQYRLDVTNLTTRATTAFPSADPTQFQLVQVGPVSVDIPNTGGDLVYPSGVLNGGLGYVNSVLDFPAGDGPVRVTINEVAVLGAPANAVPSTASNRLALSPYPEAYHVVTVPDNFQFSQPVGVTLWYPTPGLGAVPGTPVFGASSMNESSLATFIYDSFRGEWRPAAANQDRNNHTMSTRIVTAGSSTGFYGIFQSVPVAPQDFRPPQKIITPNGDGINDTLDFGNLGADATIDIYSVTGRRVRHLAGSFVWDGRDDSGSIVESGVYIYQFKLNGQMVSGIVAVAK
jgi:hypothetical protein